MHYDTLQSLPKVELHCHLDGSISLDTLRLLSRRIGQSPANIDQVPAKEKCLDLMDYLASFNLILPLLQSTENLSLAAYDVAKQASLDGVIYQEIRFAPRLHLDAGLTVTEVIEAVAQGIRQAMADYPIEVRLILCGMRHHSKEETLSLLQELKQTPNSLVVGFDFAGDENAGESQDAAECVAYAKNIGLNITLHAGECGCAHNVALAIHMGAQRIGHGVATILDEQVMDLVKQQQILLELCPSSNIQTNAISNWESYPLHTLLNEGIAVSISTDNRTVSSTNLSREYQLLFDHCQLTLQQMYQLNLNAANFSFTDEAHKERLKLQLHGGYQV